MVQEECEDNRKVAVILFTCVYTYAQMPTSL